MCKWSRTSPRFSACPPSGEIGGRAPLSAASGERQPLKKLKPGASQVIRRGQDAGAASQTLPDFRSTASPRVDVRKHNRRRAIPPAQTRRLGVDQRAEAADLAKRVQSIMIGRPMARRGVGPFHGCSIFQQLPKRLGFLNTVRTERFDQVLAIRALLPTIARAA
jgi:hypothetical protein